MKIGVLALQGDVSEHAALLARLGSDVVEVRSPADLVGIDGLVLPGGESTTMSLLLGSSGLAPALLAALQAGMPALGTCAGMILLASEVVDGRPDQMSLGAVDISVRRNVYGRQVDSFECEVALESVDGTAGGEGPLHAVFIRAPGVERVGPSVEVLGRLPASTGARSGEPVLCRQGPVVVSAFHPELSGDPRVHQVFLSGC
ncbi:MAG: pyridoxal 5'-phosphate synthase glutaminase subunit PdxT [Acidimicrobiales bacterium]